MSTSNRLERLGLAHLEDKPEELRKVLQADLAKARELSPGELDPEFQKKRAAADAIFQGKVEEAKRKREQERRRRNEARERPAQHPADERGPETAPRAGTVDRPAPDHGDLQRVHPVAEQAQHRR